VAVSRSLRPLAATLASLAAFAAAAAVLDPELRPGRRTASLPPEDEAGIRQTLSRFQEIYEDFFASGGRPDLIDSFPATRELKHQVFRDVGFVRDAALVFVQDLATSTVLETRRTGEDTAEAVVYEEWNCVFQKSVDRTPATQLKGFGQGFRYELTRHGSGWIVTRWDLASVAAPPADQGRKW
jgi:hypothetical protein